MLLRSAIIEALVNGDIYHSGAPEIDPEIKTNTKAYKLFEEWCDKYVKSCSIDLPLGTDYWGENTQAGVRMDNDTQRFFVDVEAPQSKYQYLYFNTLDKDPKDPTGERKIAMPFSLGPKNWCLARTEHIIGVGEGIIGVLHTRSTAGRYGLCVRRSAGLIDPGYRNYITLEIHNDTNRMFPLKPGICYAQITFERGEGEGLYKGVYTQQNRPWTPEDMLPQQLQP